MKQATKWHKILADVDDDSVFYFNKSGVASSLIDLHEKLQRISKKELEHHVNEEKNDVASWVRQVLDDHELANEIDAVQDRDSMLQSISRRIKEADAYITHMKRLPVKREPRLQKIVDDITHIENDMEHILGHTTTSAVHVYDTKSPTKHTTIVEIVIGMVIGMLFTLLILQISGII